MLHCRAARTQEEGFRRMQELKTEISVLEESRQAERKELEELKENHSSLTSQLEEEQVVF